MKIIETLYERYLRKNEMCVMKYKYLERYFKGITTDNFCFLELNVSFESGGKIISESVRKVGNTNHTYGVQHGPDISQIREIINVVKYTKVYTFSKILFDADMKQKVINLLNADVAGVLLPVFLKRDENPSALKLLMFYMDKSMPDISAVKEALMEGKFYQRFPVLAGLIMAEVVSVNPLSTFESNLTELKPLVSSDENVFNYIMRQLEFPDSRTFLTVANAKYERQENHGTFVFYKVINTVHYDLDWFSQEAMNFRPNPDDTNIAGLENGCRIKFKEACALNWKNAREVRKYLEMSDEDMPLVIAGFFRDFPVDLDANIETKWKVYGLASADLKDYDAKVFFRGDRGFEISFQQERIFYDGVSYHFLGKGEQNDSITEKVDKVHFLTPQQKELIVSIIKEASKQHHGTMLVFHEEAEKEAERLGKCGRALEVEPIYIQNEIKRLVQLASIDGALIIGFDGICYALGAILDGNASENSQRGRGARYNSGLAYVDTQHKLENNCLVVVISEDESIDVLMF